ncbi:MAG: RNA polymerase sigma factor [Candidatus Onthomonas sp.]
MTEFERVYQDYSRRVYRFLLALSGDENQAEELTQEVFYRALLHIDQFEGRSALFTWLCEIGKNCWLTEQKKRRRHRPLEEAAQRPDTDPGPEGEVLERALQQTLRREIADLPEDWRDVVILHLYGGISLKEIAARRGKSESWGKVTYYRARQQLRKRLEEYR